MGKSYSFDMLEKFLFKRIKVITTRHHVDASFITKVKTKIGILL